jgi:hypothetical protein
MARSPREDLPGHPIETGEAASSGQRIAGGVLILQVIVAIALGAPMVRWVWVGSLIFDVVIGVALVAGVGRFTTWALVRVAFGVLATLMMLVIARQNSYYNPQLFVGAAIYACFALALLLLLVGEAGRARIIVGSTLAAFYLALQCLAAWPVTTTP